ncbi:TPA: hypothetical protein ACH3X2_012201 [Trebouxia sp. C0005]
MITNFRQAPPRSKQERQRLHTARSHFAEAVLADGTQATPHEFRQRDSQIGHAKDCATSAAEATLAEAATAEAGPLTSWTQSLRAHEVLPSGLQTSILKSCLHAGGEDILQAWRRRRYQAKFTLPEHTIPAAAVHSNKQLHSTGNTTLSGGINRLPSSHGGSQLQHKEQIYRSEQLRQPSRHGRSASAVDVELDGSPVSPDGPLCCSPSCQPTSTQLQNSKDNSEGSDHPVYVAPERYQSQPANCLVAPSLQASSEMATWPPAMGSCQGDTSIISHVPGSKVPDILGYVEADRLNLTQQQLSIFGSPPAVTSEALPPTPPDSSEVVSLELCCQTAEGSHRRACSQSEMQVPPGIHAAVCSGACLQTALSNDEPCIASSSASAALLCLPEAEPFTQGTYRPDLGLSASTGPEWSEPIPLQSELSSPSPFAVLEEGPEPLNHASQASSGRAYAGQATASGKARESANTQSPSSKPGDGDERLSSPMHSDSLDDLATDRSSLSSLASLLGDTIMSALFTDHATHAAAAHMTDPARASCGTAAAAAAPGHCARDSSESDHATASSACSTGFVCNTLAPAAMLRDVQVGSAVCPPSPNFLTMSLHKTSSGPSTAPFHESATATPLEDSHSECDVPVKVGIGVHITLAASHSTAPESTVSKLGVNQAEPGEPAASSAAEPLFLTRARLLLVSSGMTTLPHSDAQVAVESAGPSSQANRLFNACSIEQHLVMGIDPNSSSAVRAPADAHRPAAPDAWIKRRDSNASLSSATSAQQADAARGFCTAVDCQVIVSNTDLECLARFSSEDPSSSHEASTPATTSSAGASQAQPGLPLCTADPSSPATTAPGATSISAGASPAGGGSSAGTSRSASASPNDISSIAVEPTEDSGSLAGASPAAAISQVGASLTVAGTPAVSSPNASSQSGVEACPLQDPPNLQIAGCAESEPIEVKNGGQSHSAVTALFEEMSHACDGSPLALAVLNHSPATMRLYEHASHQNASCNLAQQRDNSSDDSGTSYQLGAIPAEMLELMDACGVHESLKELIAADAQFFDYSANELLSP